MTAAAVISVGIWFCPSDAEADNVPNWDVAKSCRGAAESGSAQDASVNLQRCLDSEKQTREQLDKDWSTFPAADRVRCVKTQTFSPTYSELATCLEMNRDLRNGAKPPEAIPQRK
jgi:hypothetical protein